MTIFKRAAFKGLLLAATLLGSPLILTASPQASAQEALSGCPVQIAPPALPVYVQPPMPEAGYIWTPGYWARADTDYYWVPGTWAEPPAVGVLWPPPIGAG